MHPKPGNLGATSELTVAVISSSVGRAVGWRGSLAPSLERLPQEGPGGQRHVAEQTEDGTERR
jgi:hypothetical protein